MTHQLDTGLLEAFNPSLRAILEKLPNDEKLLEEFRSKPMDVFQRFGAPTERLSPAMRAEIEGFTGGYPFRTCEREGIDSCTVCEIGIGITIVLLGGVVLIVALVVAGPESALAVAVAAALVAAGYVAVTATMVSGIILALVALGMEAGTVLFEAFIPALCKKLGSCAEDAPPLDPAISRWIGEQALTIGNGHVSVLRPPAQTVFDQTLYLAYVPSGSPTPDVTVFGISLASFDINSGLGWSTAMAQPQGQGISISGGCAPSLAGGAVMDSSQLYMVYVSGSGVLSWCAYSNGQWTAPAPVPGVPTLSPSAQIAALVSSGLLMVCYADAGPMASVMYDGTRWSTPTSVDTGKVLLRPVLVEYQTNVLFMYCDSKDNKIKYVAYVRQSGTWSKPINTGYQTKAAMGACASGNKLYLVYESVHHDFLYWATYDGDAWVHDAIREPDLSSAGKPKPKKISTKMGLSIAASGQSDDTRLFMTFVADDGTNQLHGTVG